MGTNKWRVSSDPKEKLRLDMEYIEMKTFRMDIRILCKTVLIVLNGNGAR